MFINIIHYNWLTRWNANQCCALWTTYLIFWGLSSSFPAASLIFTAARLFHQVIALNFDRFASILYYGGCFETLNLLHVSSWVSILWCLTFCDILHETKQKRKQTKVRSADWKFIFNPPFLCEHAWKYRAHKLIANWTKIARPGCLSDSDSQSHRAKVSCCSTIALGKYLLNDINHIQTKRCVSLFSPPRGHRASCELCVATAN